MVLPVTYNHTHSFTWYFVQILLRSFRFQIIFIQCFFYSITFAKTLIIFNITFEICLKILSLAITPTLSLSLQAKFSSIFQVFIRNFSWAVQESVKSSFDKKNRTEASAKFSTLQMLDNILNYPNWGLWFSVTLFISVFAFISRFHVNYSLMSACSIGSEYTYNYCYFPIKYTL